MWLQYSLIHTAVTYREYVQPVLFFVGDVHVCCCYPFFTAGCKSNCPSGIIKSPWSWTMNLERIMFWLVWHPLCLCRLPQRVSERLVEGALVHGARWQPVPAQGPWGPAAPGHRGATQRSRGGDRRPRPQTPLLLLHPAGRQWAGIFRGEYIMMLKCHFELLMTELLITLSVCVCVSTRPAAPRIWAAGWVCCLQRPAAPPSLKSCTTTTSMWIRWPTYGTLPDTPSCESLPTVDVSDACFHSEGFVCFLN